ncbi:hypothetical protein OG225_25185 [Nocardia sp. NBC_01377]
MTDNPQRKDIDTEEQPVKWPDPSPLADWWEQVMGLDKRTRQPRVRTTAA